MAKRKGFPHKRVFLVPLDSRPVCYGMPRLLAESAGLEMVMPSPKQLGHLKTPANERSFFRWVKNSLFENEPLIVALDTVAYGGLIPSRVGNESLEQLNRRVEKFFDQIRVSQCYAFSSILRVPDYDNDEEEPAYWRRYGKKLHDYSARWHRTGKEPASGIPADVLADFTARRNRNHALNEKHLNRLVSGDIDYLTFCQDDTGEYGLNVQEAEVLKALIARRKCGGKAQVKTGADEVAVTMLARWVHSHRLNSGQEALKIWPLYTSETGKDLIARFDGLPIATVVSETADACGVELAENRSGADIVLLVHTPATRQGDHCGGPQAVIDPAQREVFFKELATCRKRKIPVAVADVSYANGADPVLTEQLVSTAADLSNLYGYAAWNTPGNTVGTSLAMAVVRKIAEENGCFDAGAFGKLLLIRFGDDWLYQSEVRQNLRKSYNGTLPEEAILNLQMADSLALLKTRLNLDDAPTHCRFPCGRTFEIDIDVS